MQQYDPHKWTSHFFDIEGSMVREILVRVILCVVWSVLVVALYDDHHPQWFHRLAIAETAHAFIGPALGLLLVFRTNSSYDRFWEGRKQWGSIVNETRNLARQAETWLAADRELVKRIILWTTAYAYSTLHRLRGDTDIGPLRDSLPPSEIQAALDSGHVPLAVARRLTELLHDAQQRGLIDSIQLQSLDHNVQLLIDYCGACERIRSTPLPFAYIVHLRRALFLYCFTLPLALIQRFGWETVPVTLLISYVLFGIEEIGVEIENPFGLTMNDLPLETICDTIARDLQAIIADGEKA